MGKLCSLILTLLVGLALAAALLILPRLAFYEGMSPAMQTLVSLGAPLILVGAPAAIAGVFFDRALRRLRKYTSAAIDRTRDVPLPASPRIFKGFIEGFAGPMQEILQRESALIQELRDLKVSQKILETDRDQLQGVLDALRDGVVVTDSFNEIITVNTSAAEILGFSTEEGSRKPVEQVIRDRRLAQLIRETREARNFSETRTIEHEMQVADESIPYQVSLSSLENNKGDVGAVVAILHDLRREREIAQMKSDFVSKASHELRTPLSSIRAYVEMLVDGEASDEASRREFYGIIHNETDRLGRMIDNMLNISRIEAGIIQIDREPVDLRALLKRAMETLEPQAREKEISLSVKPSPVDLTADGDPDMLYQVVLNLTSNAIKYTPEGGRVTLAADSDNLTRSILVTVTDTGLGIPPDALPRLFEKFFRIESFKRVAKGTGLGLNLCKHIVETVHQGQIGVDSQLGMGSKFWFTIPMRYAGAQAA